MNFIKTLLIVLLIGMTGISAAGADTNEYQVGVGDVLMITMLRPEKLDVERVVAPDGTINFPYIGTVKVEPLTLAAIQENIERQLSDGYVKYPVVSVALKESNSKRFFVYGEVIKPGTYVMEDRITVLRAIAMAGGLTKFGSANKVKVLRLRPNGEGYDTINVNLKAIMNDDAGKDIPLQPGDMVVVSEGTF